MQRPLFPTFASQVRQQEQVYAQPPAPPAPPAPSPPAPEQVVVAGDWCGSGSVSNISLNTIAVWLFCIIMLVLAMCIAVQVGTGVSYLRKLYKQKKA